MKMSMHRPIRSEEMIHPPYASGKGCDRYKNVATLPCNRCEKRKYCEDNQVACEAYKHYSTEKYAKAETLDALPHIPSRKIYNTIYDRRRA